MAAPCCRATVSYLRIVIGRPTERLVGRDREMAVVSRVVRDVLGGHTLTLVVEGEAGVGKTRLLQHLLDDARAGGATVCRGEAHPFERTRPFGVVVDALDLRRRSPDPRRAAIAHLLTGEPDRSGSAPGGTSDVRYRVVEEILDLVDASCAQASMVVVLEDLHWADDSTLVAFRSMVRGLVDLSLLLVASLRPSPRSVARPTPRRCSRGRCSLYPT